MYALRGRSGSVLCRPQLTLKPSSLFGFGERGNGGDDEGDADESPLFHEDVAEAF